MTLAARIALDVSAVFLETDDFAQTITHYPEDDREGGESIIAIFDTDELEGQTGGGNDGEGRRLHSDNSTTIRDTGVVECASTVEITTGRTQRNSTFLIDDEIWQAKRVISRDTDMQSVLVIRIASKITRRTRTNQG